MLSLQSFLRKGVSLGHVGKNQNLKDLKEREREHRNPGGHPLANMFYVYQETNKRMAVAWQMQDSARPSFLNNARPPFRFLMTEVPL